MINTVISFITTDITTHNLLLSKISTSPFPLGIDATTLKLSPTILPSFTERQLEVLNLLVHGHDGDRITKKLNTSTSKAVYSERDQIAMIDDFSLAKEKINTSKFPKSQIHCV